MSEPPAVDAARNPSTGRAAVPLAWRGEGDPPSRFHRGAHPPYGIRWFGSTALLGHLRRVAASIVASQAVDTRDWMRPERPHELLAHAARVLRAPVADAATLVERLGRPLWIDFVSDTGDDRDVSGAVARLVFAEYAPADGGDATILPRGDILLFGGDTAYPVATGREILRRVVQPWNEVLQDVGTGGRRRVLLGIPGNHDWYDGLDGFARLFRRDAVVGMLAHWEADRAHPARKRPPGDRSRAALVRQLHLDELAGSVDLIRSAYQSLRAIVRGGTLHRVARLALRGYTPVQEASHWALPLAPGLDLWGVDRQLRRLDFRQRTFFIERRAERPGDRLVFLAPDPALSFGEPNPVGQGDARRLPPHPRVGPRALSERRPAPLRAARGRGVPPRDRRRRRRLPPRHAHSPVPARPGRPASTRTPPPAAGSRSGLPWKLDGRHGRLPPAHDLRAARRDPAPGPRARPRGRDGDHGARRPRVHRRVHPRGSEPPHAAGP